MFFCVPALGRDVITEQLIEDGAAVDDSDSEPNGTSLQMVLEHPVGSTDQYEYQHARRRGTSSYRSDRPTMFFPVFIDELRREVRAVGDPIAPDQEPSFDLVDGLRPIWPIDHEGNHRRWQRGAENFRRELESGNLVLGRYDKKHDSWTINIRKPRRMTKKHKTVWWSKRHDAGTHGTDLLTTLLGRAGLFPFPKSVYTVRDCLAAVVADRPDALIIDFFAGSGTTFHAVALLNSEDDGNRRSIMVTNNEVGLSSARTLAKQSLYPGDAAFEANGIFEQVTRPRCEATLTGLRPDGKPIPGQHIGGRPFADGFSENVEFFRLDYLDQDEVDLGMHFDALLPALWLAAGGHGPREGITDGAAYSVSHVGRYGVLFRSARFAEFKLALEDQPEVTHVYLVTDSHEAFAEMRSALPTRLHVSMLYADYLRAHRMTSEHLR